MARKAVTILTENYRMKGEIEIAPDERITDYVTGAKNFIALTNAEVRTHEGTLVFMSEFLNVHRDHIVVFAPQDLTHRN